MLGTLGDYRGCINLARREFDSANKTMINAWAGSGLEWPAPPPTPLLHSHRGFSLLNIPTLSQGFLSPQQSYPLTGVYSPRLHQLPTYPLTGVSLSSTFLPSHRGFWSAPPPTPLLPSHRGFRPAPPPTPHLPSHRSFLATATPTPHLPSHRGFSLLNIHTLSQGFLARTSTNSPPTLSQGFLSPPRTPLLPSHRGFSLLNIPTLSQGFLSPPPTPLLLSHRGFSLLHQLPSYPLTGVSLSSTNSHPTLSQGVIPPQHSYPLTGFPTL